jgi:hypothetical protein
MEELSDTRRGVLRKGAVALGAATVAGSAGCADSVGDGGGGDGGGGGAGYTRWLPEPGIVEFGDHYGFNATDYSALAEDEDEFSDSANLSSVESRWRPLNIGYEDVTMLLGFGSTQVVEAEFERADAVDALTGSEFQIEEDGEYEGFQILRIMGATAFGVGDDAVVTGVDRDTVETVIDTNNGDETRYVDESEAFGELTDRLGAGDVVAGSTTAPVSAAESDPTNGRFESQVGRGRQITVDGGTADARWVVVFEAESDVDVDSVDQWVEASQNQFGSWSDIAVDANGRSAVIEATADTSSVT